LKNSFGIIFVGWLMCRQVFGLYRNSTETQYSIGTPSSGTEVKVEKKGTSKNSRRD